MEKCDICNIFFEEEELDLYSDDIKNNILICRKCEEETINEDI